MTAYRYTGRGEAFLQGVPAMDLGEEDVAALPPEARAELEEHVRVNGPAYQAEDPVAPEEEPVPARKPPVQAVPPAAAEPDSGAVRSDTL
ncbi:MAG TPA: hypothetical protein VKQ71_01605 [Acidimicrobiales bacterium]|nr:hypothetical protein [Acidimicrobiales bacterium]